MSPETEIVSAERLAEYGKARRARGSIKDVQALPGAVTTPLRDGRVRVRVPREQIGAVMEMTRPGDRMAAERAARDAAARPTERIIRPDGTEVRVPATFRPPAGFHAAGARMILAPLAVAGRWLQCGHRAAFAGPNGDCLACEEGR